MGRGWLCVCVCVCVCVVCMRARLCACQCHQTFLALNIYDFGKCVKLTLESKQEKSKGQMKGKVSGSRSPLEVPDRNPIHAGPSVNQELSARLKS